MSRTPLTSLRPEWLVIALCPAIAISDLAINALTLGAVIILASIVSAVLAALLQRLPQDLRWTLGLLVLATLVSGIALLLNAWLHEVHGALGVFLPLLVANLAVQWHAEQVANQAPLAAGLSGLRAGVTIAVAVALIAMARELVGHGSVLAGALDQQLFRADMGFLLAMLPPGAFIAFGILLALRNWVGQRRRHE